MPDVVSSLIAATHSPFNESGTLNLNTVEQQAVWLKESGVRGVYVCGTTGEGVSLTVAERRELVARWVDVSRGDLNVIAHVGHHSLPEAVALAEAAGQAGVDGISAIAPSFLQPSSVESLVAYCATIAQAAPDRPFYYYHSPGMTGCSLPLDAIIECSLKTMPSFAGVKFNDDNIALYQQTLDMFGSRIDVPFGVDEMLLEGLACGATSAIGSTYNYAAPHFYRLITAYEAGDTATAERLASEANEMVDLLKHYGVLAAGKALMKLRGVACGGPRLPLATLTPELAWQLIEAASELAAIKAGPMTDPLCKS